MQISTISAERSTHIHEMGVSHARLECHEMCTLGQQAHRRQLAVGIMVPRREQA